MSREVARALAAAGVLPGEEAEALRRRLDALDARVAEAELRVVLVGEARSGRSAILGALLGGAPVVAPGAVVAARWAAAPGARRWRADDAPAEAWAPPTRDTSHDVSIGDGAGSVADAPPPAGLGGWLARLWAWLRAWFAAPPSLPAPVDPLPALRAARAAWLAEVPAPARVEVEDPAPSLPAGAWWIDTPGTNRGDGPGEARLAAVLADEADVALVVVDLQQALSSTTRDRVARLGAVGLPARLVLTKADRAWAAAGADGSDEPPAAQVAAAVALAERRFAAALGRPPAGPAWVVALPPSGAAAPDGAILDAAGLAAALGAWLARDRDALRAGRAPRIEALATEAARGAVERARARVVAAEAEAEARALPPPGVVRGEAVEAARQSVGEAVAGLGGAAGPRVAEAVTPWVAEALAALDRARDPVATARWRASWATALPERVAGALAELDAWVDREVDLAVRAPSRAALESLDRAYGALVAPPEGALVRAGLPDLPPPALAPEAALALPALRVDEVVPALGGAGAGALVGSALLPGVGTVLGALAGAAAGAWSAGERARAADRAAVAAWSEAVVVEATTRLVARAEARVEAHLAALDARLDAQLRAAAARVEAARAAEARARAALRMEQAALAGWATRLDPTGAPAGSG